MQREEEYEITPKGIAYLAMIDSGLIDNLDDPRAHKFWELFCGDMLQHGYIREDN